MSSRGSFQNPQVPTPRSTNTSSADHINHMTQVSFGLTGLFLFFGVVMVIVIVRRKCVGEDDKYSERGASVNLGERGRSVVYGGEVERLCSVNSSLQWLEESTMKELVTSVVIDCRHITMGRMLGEGQFGAVYEAKLIQDDDPNYGGAQPERVAVKTLRGAGMDRDEVEGFLREGIIMKDFHHPHVLGLVGVAFGDHSIPMIILPYMENGSLREYIGDPDLSLTIRKLLQFAREVALGMDYLACQKFVHRDLATRNCMLDEKKVVKVADFGLSRDIYTREYYASADHQARLPVKWMAIESLTRAVYTTKSDVWSFGVLIWELMTRGVTPYPDVTNWDIRAYVCSGRRMPKPQLCPDDVYDIMVRCWQEDPRDRPDFCDLAAELEELLSSEVEISPDSDYYVNVEPLTP